MMSPGWRAPCWLQVFGKVAGCWSILWNRFGASASQAFAGEIDAMGVVNEPVEDGVGICRVADEGVPFVDRDLTGENGRATPIAFLEDLERSRRAPASSGSRLHGNETRVWGDQAYRGQRA